MAVGNLIGVGLIPSESISLGSTPKYEIHLKIWSSKQLDHHRCQCPCLRSIESVAGGTTPAKAIHDCKPFLPDAVARAHILLMHVSRETGELPPDLHAALRPADGHWRDRRIPMRSASFQSTALIRRESRFFLPDFDQVRWSIFLGTSETT